MLLSYSSSYNVLTDYYCLYAIKQTQKQPKTTTQTLCDSEGVETMLCDQRDVGKDSVANKEWQPLSLAHSHHGLKIHVST